ncbi:uncharacterized protein BDW43DRAFT_295249, partial [Aspergillus alliaceus]|uniref:uncharacterized protein n=1 Tax=Petromyces alliaceus TaxID=209559 RepID=UPI0012A58BEC
RDFLSVIVSEVNIKSLFNTSHDICYYCQSCLNPKTIHRLIILLMADHFQLREDCRIEKKESNNISDIYNYLKQPGDKDYFEYISDSNNSGDPEENLFNLLDKDYIEDKDIPEIPNIQSSTPIEKEHAQFHKDNTQAINYYTLASYWIYNTQY